MPHKVKTLPTQEVSQALTRDSFHQRLKKAKVVAHTRRRLTTEEGHRYHQNPNSRHSDNPTSSYWLRRPRMCRYNRSTKHTFCLLLDMKVQGLPPHLDNCATHAPDWRTTLLGDRSRHGSHTCKQHRGRRQLAPARWPNKQRHRCTTIPSASSHRP